MKCRQRGAALLVAVILIVTVAAFAVIVAASQSAGDVRGNDIHADSVQALYLAETGIERSLKRFATGTACTALGDDPGTVPVEATHTIGNLASIGIAGGYSITLMNGFTTDFAGAALPATQCRIPATGTVTVGNVTRTIHAIVDRNLLEGPDNPTFNNPTTAGAAPSGWAITTNPPPAPPPNPPRPPGYAGGGGPDCSRSAWVVKPGTGNHEARASGSTPVSFTIAGASVTTVSFHYRVNNRGGAGGGCVGGAASGPAFPCGTGGANPGLLCFRLVATAVPVNNNSLRLASADTSAVARACPDPLATATPVVFAPCQNGYQVGYPTKATLTITDGGAGTRTMTQFQFYMLVRGNNIRREFFLDHIEATNNTAIGAAHVRVWRDCSSAVNPVNCV